MAQTPNLLTGISVFSVKISYLDQNRPQATTCPRRLLYYQVTSKTVNQLVTPNPLRGDSTTVKCCQCINAPWMHTFLLRTLQYLCLII